MERFNRTLTQMLLTCLEEHSPEWDLALPKLCMAYNSSKQSTTSPFFLMFGREACLPVDLLYASDPDVNPPTQDLPQYVQTLRKTLTSAFSQVREHIGTQQEWQQAFYNKRVHGKPPQARYIGLALQPCSSSGVG